MISPVRVGQHRLILFHDSANVWNGMKRIGRMFSPKELREACEWRFPGTIEIARYYSGEPRNKSVRLSHENARDAGYDVVITTENSDGRMQVDLGCLTQSFDGVVLLSNDGKAFAELLDSLGRDFRKRIYVVAPAYGVSKSLKEVADEFGESVALPELKSSIKSSKNFT